MDATLPTEFLLNIQREIQISAPADIVFESILENAGPGMVMPDGISMHLKDRRINNCLDHSGLAT